MKDGITFDTGALIALERRSQRARDILDRATRLGVRVSVPTPVIVEWWRGRTDVREAILRGLRIVPLTSDLAKRAGEALASVRGATAIDAVVMASAAERGDVVYTSDVTDLSKLATHYPNVRVFAIG